MTAIGAHRLLLGAGALKQIGVENCPSQAAQINIGLVL